MKQYVVTILLSSGRVTKTIIYADSSEFARELAIEIFGGSMRVLGYPYEYKDG